MTSELIKNVDSVPARTESTFILERVDKDLPNHPALHQLIRPLRRIRHRHFVRDAETLYQYTGRILHGEVASFQLVPEQQGGAVQGDDLGHVGLQLALFHYEVLACDLAYLINILNLHLKWFLVYKSGAKVVKI